MDELIIKLYQKNIIKVKNVTLKNGLITPIYLDFFEIFKYKELLNLFLETLNDFINENISFNNIFGIDSLTKNLCTLLYYKYNYSNIFNINSSNENVLILKENYGLTSSSKIKIKKQEIIGVIFLVKYGNMKNLEYPNYCFLDNMYMLSILYQRRILNHEKYFNFFKIINNIKETSNVPKKIKNNVLKSKILFDTLYIEKLEIKDFVKTLDFICPHISLIKINLHLFGNNVSSILKLLIYHNVIILDYFNKNILEIIENICNSEKKNYNDYVINLINIEDFLKPCSFNMDHIIIDNITIPEFENTRLSILNKVKDNYFIIGYISKKCEYIFENKLKIGYYENDESIEKKLLLLNYNLVISSNAKNIVNLKQYINSIMN